MAFEKLKKLIGDDVEDNGRANQNDDYYNVSKNAFSDMTGGGSKMILLEPRAYSESQTIADYLKARNAVVVNLKRVTPDQAKRIVDFLSGTLYAISGDLQKLGNGIFLCTPNNVNVEGKMSIDEAKQKSTKVKKEEESSEYDW